MQSSNIHKLLASRNYAGRVYQFCHLLVAAEQVGARHSPEACYGSLQLFYSDTLPLHNTEEGLTLTGFPEPFLVSWSVMPGLNGKPTPADGSAGASDVDCDYRVFHG